MLQGTEEWLKARCGSIGASDAPRVVRRTKSGYSADRDTLMALKVLERITGAPVETFKTAAMLTGTAREPEARTMYELLHSPVEQVAFVKHPSILGAHASPDGYVGGRGLLEIKCPQPPAHLDTLLSDFVPGDHVTQMQWQMACTGREWCDYVSYNPDFPPAMRMWIRRVPKNITLIASLEREISGFIRELDDKVERLTRRYPTA